MSTLEKAFVSVAGLLLALGLLMVYSASITSRPTEFEAVYLSRQLLFAGIACAAAAGTSRVPARVWRRLAIPLFAATVVLLVAVLVPSIGVSVKGARRWLRWGSISLQPSEIAKLTLPLLLCRLAADGAWRAGGRVRSIMTAAAPLAITLGLIVIEPDLGTAMFLALTSAVALFLCGWPASRFLLAGAAAIPAAAGLIALRPYQLARVQGFVSAWRNFSDAPYQLRQSLTAVGTGGLTGAGLGEGRQKLSFLPEANTDFVFAVIGEELGLVGTLGVLLLWGALFGLGLRLLAPLRRGGFEHAAGATLLFGLVLQAAINMAVVLALVPPKGISLPLISYGGSNLLVSVTAVGLLLSLSRCSSTEAATVVQVPPGDHALDAGLAPPAPQ